jgi:hypothetical protein
MTTTAFIIEIVRGTPRWVWALLALVLYLGYTSTKDRTIDVRRLLIMPLAMVGVSLSSVIAGNISVEAATAWFVALALAAAAGGRLGLASGAEPGEQPMTVRLPGEWLSLVLIILMFASRYAFAVTIAIAPRLAAEPAFVIVQNAVIGGLGGLFLGRGLAMASLAFKGRRLMAS